MKMRKEDESAYERGKQQRKAKAGTEPVYVSRFWPLRGREFDSCIIKTVLAGRIKPVLFLSNFLH